MLLPRHASTSSTETKPILINKNLSFRQAHDSPLDQQERPLVLIYGWLVAKAKHIHKYGDFYLGKGFDVLHIKVEPLQLMWPKVAQGVVKQVVQFTERPERNRQPILVHGFSVGGYLFGETLVKIHSDPKTEREVGERIQGQIFDSPVDIEGVPRGFSQAVTPVPVLQKVLETSVHGYMRLFPKSVTDHYQRSSATFHANKLKTPTLFLYSSSDPIGIPEPIENLVEKWRAKGVTVDTKRWEDTPHVSHFHYHPVQYIHTLTDFLQSLGLIDETAQQKEKMVLRG